MPFRLLNALAAAILGVLLFLVPSQGAAQQVDVIRGKVTGPDSLPITGARITATSLSGNVNRSAKSGTDGRFTITFPNGEGDYFLTVSALGFTPKRFEVKRTADQEILIADTRLSRMVGELDEVRIVGSRSKTTRDDRSPDIGGAESTVNSGNVAANQAGDLAAMAASLPGVQLVPGAEGDPSGFSVLGLGADQNSQTLNGANFGGSNLPRDAGVQSVLSTSPYDVSRGGFSGAQFQLRTRSGSNFLNRSLSLNIDAPALQWTDKAAKALGQQFSNYSLGGSLSGPLVMDKAFYNVSYQLGRRSNDLRSIANTDAAGLLTAGIAPDSANRLLNVLRAQGIPLFPASNPQDRNSDQGSLLGSIDFSPPGSRVGAAYNITANGSWNRTAPATGSVTELPAHSGERTNYSGGLQGRHSAYFDIGVLTETNVTLSASKNSGDAYLDLPSASVRLNSPLADGTNGLRTITFGGNPFLGTSQSSTSASVLNTLSWFSLNNRHRFKLTTELRRDAYSQNQTTNQLGSFAFNSLADLEAGRALSYTRQLSPRVRSGNQLVAAMSLGDSWRATNDLQVQYGVRVDGNRFDRGPTENPLVAQTFGTTNATAPNKVYVSPRVGFSWQYGTAPQIAGFEGALRGPRAVVRGGIGMFQNVPQATQLGFALDNTGLANGVQQLGCFGTTAPATNWGGWLNDPSTIPTTCANGAGGSPFTNAAPNVTLYSPEWAATRSLRSNLQWNGPVLANRFTASVDVTYSRNMNAASTVDLNFNATPRFTLSEEGGRPVFVPATSIDPATGAAAPQSSRVSSAFNVVNEARSDLRSDSRQVSVRLSPATFNSALSWSLSYVYGNVREQYRGFASTAGSPLDVEWSRSSFDSRHQVQYTLGYNFFDAIRLSWFGNVRSGSPYTPLVGGDVNGDGLANDRAFIANPATTADAALGTAMRNLLASASGDARECLERQLGTLAGRNSCGGAWTHTAFLSISFNPVKLGLPQRATLSFQVSNPIGAADLLLHGENNLRGWGQPASPDPVLVYPRSFNPITQRYQYEVNQRFGATRPAFSTFRSPVTLTAMLRFDIGPARERQVLTQQLDRGRRTEGQKPSEPILNALYGGGNVTINPMAQILRQADTLALTGPQADSLATLNRSYTIALAKLWSPIVKEFAVLPDNYDQGKAYARYRAAREASVDLLLVLAPAVRGLLTDAQRRKLPDIVTSHLDARYLRSIRSATVGGAGAGGFFPGMGGLAIPQGGGGTTVIIR